MENTSTPVLSDRERFHRMLTSYPRLSTYWDSSENSLRYLYLKKAHTSMSHGEQIMARFFMSVWQGKNEEFDFIDAASQLDMQEKKIIVTWFADPFWP
ncbi:hypothetical protein DFO55_12457 [Grimontella sp. AG753]|nr:hypothetical protein DFO55_12457 [Grimontella sp. AG753]